MDRHLAKKPLSASALSFADETATSSVIPALPPLVQANLLAVGMRVRKSVPEGYKTGEDDDDDVDANDDIKVEHTPHLPHRPPRRELVPFCGLHKVGGLAVQSTARPMLPPSVFAIREENDEEENDFLDLEPPSLSSSQNTMASSAMPSSPTPSSVMSTPLATPTSNRKRGRDDVDDVDGDDDDNDVNSSSSPPHIYIYPDPASPSPAPRHLPVDVDGPHYRLGRRVLAVPRRRAPPQQQQFPETRLFSKAASSSSSSCLDQESRPVTVVAGDDFGDASFLDADLWGSDDMAMGGM